jgi:hypothetical protein
MALHQERWRKATLMRVSTGWQIDGLVLETTVSARPAVLVERLTKILETRGDYPCL